jgi:hypothetical protein
MISTGVKVLRMKDGRNGRTPILMAGRKEQRHERKAVVRTGNGEGDRRKECGESAKGTRHREKIREQEV